MSLFIGIPALYALYKGRKLNRTVIPFVILLQLSFLCEVFGLVLIKFYGNNIVSYNVSGLLGGLLCVLQLAIWDENTGNRWIYFSVAGILPMSWFLEWLLVRETNYFFSYSIVTQSLILVALSVNVAMQRFYNNVVGIKKDAIFIICIAFIIFNSYGLLTELYLLWGFQVYASWHKYVAGIFSFVNFFVNLLYLYAVTCMPQKIRCSS